MADLLGLVLRINLAAAGAVVLTLLLSRNLIKTYFERRHRLLGSGFRTKLVAAFIGFALIPTVLLAVVASGLVNKSVDMWFNTQVIGSTSWSRVRPRRWLLW